MVLAPDVRGLLDKLEKLHPPVITLPIEALRSAFANFEPSSP